MKRISGRQMERVKRAQGPVRYHVAGQVADRGGQLPQFTAGPERIDLAARVGETALGHAALLPEPNEGARGFDEGQARGHQHGHAATRGSMSGVVPRSTVARKATEVSR